MLSDKPIFSMSKFGGCARTIVAQHLELIPDSNEGELTYLFLAAREGNRHEQWIKEDLPEHGYQSLTPKEQIHCDKCDRFGVHTEIDDDAFSLIGHVDDLVMPILNPRTLFAEYKALGRNTSSKLERNGLEKHRMYSMQFSCYAFALDTPGLYVVKSRDTGKMNVRLEDPQYTGDDILERGRMLAKYIEAFDLPECDVMEEGIDYPGCTSLCKPEITEAPLPEELEEWILKLRQVKAMEKASKTIKSEATGMVMAYMDASGRRRIEIDGMLVSMVRAGKTFRYDIPREIKDEYKVERERPAYLRTEDRKVQ